MLGDRQPLLLFLSCSEILASSKMSGKMCGGDTINTFCNESLVVIAN